MTPLELVKLTPLMKLTRGKPEILIGLIDGPIDINNPDLNTKNIRQIPGKLGGVCSIASSSACQHGTYVAGILCARRDSFPPAICPDCTLLVRPIFVEASQTNGQPRATLRELAIAITECIEAGVLIINLSAALVQHSSKGQLELEEALYIAIKRGVIIVAAAGNQGTIGSSAITRHPWVIPVIACDIQGKTMNDSNLGSSIGKRGLSAPGDRIASLGTNGKPIISGGTSAAAPFVTGTIALLWSEFPETSAAKLKLGITQANTLRRNTVVPPVLDAWAAYKFLEKSYSNIY